MKVVVGGLVTNYEISGKGPNIVLLHGWGDNHKTFDKIKKQLSSKYTLVTVDLPGFGGTDTPKDVYSLKKYAEFVSDFLQKIGKEHILAFIGHSNGGAIAIRGLSSGILVSDKLILLASSGVRSVYRGRKKLMRLAVKTAKIPTRILPKSTQNKIRRRVYSAIGSDMFVAEDMQQTFKKVVSEDIVHDSAMIQQPTLLIYGTSDRATPLSFGERFNKQIENSKLEVIEGADHFLHNTHSEKVNKKIEDFLEK